MFRHQSSWRLEPHFDDTLTGTKGDDRLDGDGHDDLIDGRAGNDVLMGFAGNDALNGGAGDDVLSGGGGRDTLDGGNGQDILDGGSGSDLILATEVGRDMIEGGGGFDTLSFALARRGVFLDLRDGDSIGLHGVEAVVGSAFADQISGLSQDRSSIDGGDGDDTLASYANRSVLHGGAGEDKLAASTGHEWLYGDDGDDVLSLAKKTMGFGGDGDDVLTVSMGQGAGLLGGKGADHFVFTDYLSKPVPDFIIDLDHADTIDISAIDADRYTPGDQAFTLVETFDHHAGEATLIFIADSGDTRLSIDVDGDGEADAGFDIAGEHTHFANIVW